MLDEPTTGLDATVEASVLDLVRTLRNETNAAVLLIAHNLGVIRSLCDRVGVMYAGKIVEEGDAVEVFERPQFPYTVGLLRSLPRHGVRKSQRALATIPGTLPQIGTDLPTCVYVDRCPLADELCRTVVPPVVDVGVGHWTRCHHYDRHRRHPGARPRSSAQVATEGAEVARALERVEDLPPERPRRPGARQGRSHAHTTARRWASSANPGSGKSTLAKTILGIEGPDAGELDPARPRRARRDRRPAGRSRPSARSRSSSRTPIRRSTAAGPLRQILAPLGAAS